MTKNNILLILAVIAVLVLASGVLWYNNSIRKDNITYFTDEDHKDLIHITSPDLEATIVSPVTITGEARGNWYFEASFPVFVVDWDGKIIGQGIAQAQSDWMTTDFVPFKAEVSFDVSQISGNYSRKGVLILKKDNPSDLPANDDAIEMPVTF